MNSKTKTSEREWWRPEINNLFPSATDEQVEAIQTQIEAYSDPVNSHIGGIKSISDRASLVFLEDGDDEVAVGFDYYYADELYPEVTDKGQIGLEVTVFAADGSVVSSQDFG